MAFIFRKKNNKVLLVGSTPVSNILADIFFKKDINFSFIKIPLNYSNPYFSEFFIPQSLIDYFDIETNNLVDIRFIFYDEQEKKIIPVINDKEFFYEIIDKIDNDSKILIEKLEQLLTTPQKSKSFFIEVLEKNFPVYFINLLIGILNFYKINNVYELPSQVGFKYLKYFFQKNYKVSLKELGTITQEKIENIIDLEISIADYLGRKKNKIFFKNKNFEFDTLITDISFIVNKINEKEYLIKDCKMQILKDYLPEYIFNNDFVIFSNKRCTFLKSMKNDKNEKVICNIRSTHNYFNHDLYKFLKNYFPLLKEEDLSIIDEKDIILKNFISNDKAYIGKYSLFPFNFLELLDSTKIYLNNLF